MIGWQAVYWMARRHERSGNLLRARALYTSLITRGESENPKVLFRLGHVNFSLEDDAEAQKHLVKAITLSPGIAEWHYRLGFVHERMDHLESAEREYATAVGLDATRAPWHFRLGRVLSRLGNHEGATEEYRTAVELDPDRGEFHEALAQAVRKHSAATWRELEVLQSGVLFHESDVDWQLRLAQVLETLNRFDEASVHFAAAAALEPERSFLHYRYGYALQRAGESAQARLAFGRAIELDGRFGSKQLGVGVFHEARELWKPALDEYLAHARSTAFADRDLNQRIAHCAEKLGRWREACEFRKTLVTQDPNSQAAHLAWARALERAGDLATAETAYSFALSMPTEAAADADWRFRYAIVLEANGKDEDAATQFLSHARSIAEAAADDPTETAGHGAAEGDDASTPDTLDGGPSPAVDAYRSTILDEAWQSARTSQSVDVLRSTAEFATAAGRDDLAAPLRRQVCARDQTDGIAARTELAELLYTRGEYRETCALLRTIRPDLSGEPEHAMPNYPKGKWTRAVSDYYRQRIDLPIAEDVVLYESHLGSSIDCNPLAIFRAMRDDPRYRGLTHVWAVRATTQIPADLRRDPNVIFADYDSPLYRRYLATAKYLVNNVTFQNYFVRREGQKYLNTWHGTPFKALGKHMGGSVLQHSNVARNLLQCTHLISPDPHTTRVLTEGYDVDHIISATVAELGYPRNDLAIDLAEADRQRLRARVGLDDEGAPVVLYAPTWRGEVGESKFDVDRLIRDLAALTSTGMRVLFRAHPITEKLLAGTDLGVTIVPRDVNSNELLGIVDHLVTDYSSILFDALACGVPVLLYTYDREEYMRERGLYFAPSQLTPLAFDAIEDLCSALEQLSITGGYVPPDLEGLGLVSRFPNDGGASARAVAFLMDDDEEFVVSTTSESKISLLIRASLIPNGVTSAFQNLVNSLDPDRYVVTVLVDSDAVTEDPLRIAQLEELPPHVRVIGRVGPRVALPEEKWNEKLFGNQHNLWSAGSWEAYFRSFQREYRRIFGDSRFDFALEYDGYSVFWASLLACSEPRQDALIYLHSDMFEEWRTRASYLEGIFRLYEHFDRLICVSDPIAEINAQQLSTHFGLDGQKFVGGGNFLNASRLESLSAEAVDEDIVAWLGPDPHYLVTVGRISPEKDQLKLVEAFASDPGALPETKLVIVGDGPQAPALEALVRRLNLGSRVYLAGYRSNPFPIMKGADGLVLSSNHEGQPMVLLEALALGVPVLSTDIAGARSVLGDDLGMLVENSVDGLAAGLADFVENPHAPRRFDLDHYSTTLMDTFETVVLELEHAERSYAVQLG